MPSGNMKLPHLAVLLTLSLPLFAAERFVAPAGTPQGDGSRERPWDLASALGSPDRLKPGDTLTLLGGKYHGGYHSRLAGTKEAPIVVRGEPGQRVVIDSAGAEPGRAEFAVEGAWTIYQDFELTCSDPKRVTEKRGSWPEDINRGGINCRASHISFRNLVLHDLSNGIGFWSEGEGGEVYGCLIYHNGWKGPDRGHGHAIYAQNKTGVKRIEDNIFFQQFGQGLHAFGSQKATIKGFHIEGNAGFDNGVPAGDRSADIHIGSDGSVSDITIVRNYTYRNGLSLGYPWGQRNTNLKVRDNVFNGRLSLLFCEKTVVTNNTLVAGELVWVQQAGKLDPRAFEWTGNHYWRTPNPYAIFSLREGEQSRFFTWGDWRAATGLDAKSDFHDGAPAEPMVFVRPNRYQPGRGHVIAYNFGRADAILADLSSVLQKGEAFRVVRAADFFGKPVLQGTYEGGYTALPMTGGSQPPPVGMSDLKLEPTNPEFDVFVVLRD